MEIIELTKAVTNPAIRTAILNTALEALGRQTEEQPLILMPDHKK